MGTAQSEHKNTFTTPSTGGIESVFELAINIKSEPSTPRVARHAHHACCECPLVHHSGAQVVPVREGASSPVLASLILVKEAESLEDLVLGVAIKDLVGHHLQELLVFKGAAAIIIDI